MSAEFTAHCVVFCKCDRLMRFLPNNKVVCMNEACSERGKEYATRVTFEETKTVAI